MAVLYRGDHFLDLPILDLSLSGIRLYATDGSGLAPNSVLPIALPECGVHDSQVVDVRSQSVVHDPGAEWPPVIHRRPDEQAIG
jgi:hypothetical protein